MAFAQLSGVGMPPVRGAFFILFVSALVVAFLLLIAQDQVTLKVRRSADKPSQNERARHGIWLMPLTVS